MSTYLKFLSKNKLYAVIEAWACQWHCPQIPFFTYYYMTKEFRQ